VLDGDGQVGGQHRMAPTIGAIAAACHVSSIPRPPPGLNRTWTGSTPDAADR
jgi:hypothetical protein